MLTAMETERRLQQWERLSFRLLSVQVLKGEEGVRLPQQLNFCYALILVAGGEVRLIVDNRQHELSPGSVYLCMPEQTIGTAAPASGLDMSIFYFEVFAAREEGGGYYPVKDAALFPPDTLLSVFPAKQISAIYGEVFKLSGDDSQRISFRAQIDFQELLYAIHVNSRRQPRNTGTALDQAKEYIEAHYMEPITTREMAQAAGLSPKYFLDLFKKKYGKSAVDYIAELRLAEAKRLMAEQGSKLKDIAHRVGFADEFYFSRKFKKTIGVAPAVYMKRRSRKLVAYTPAVLGQLLPLNLMPYAAALHPKWTEYYYRKYRNDIPLHISAYRNNQEWEANIELLRRVPADLLIAGDELEAEERSALEELAPVYYCGEAGGDWRGQFMRLAEVLGERWQADQWLEHYDREIAAGRERLHSRLAGEAVVVVRMLGRQLYLHCNHGMAGLLYGELKLTPAYRSGSGTYDIPVTPAELAALSADHLLMLIRRESDTLAEWARLENDPAWMQIPAVQRHRVHLLSSDPWREHSAYAQLRMLRQTLQLLAADRP